MFIGDLTKLRKSTIGFVMSLWPPVHLPYGTTSWLPQDGFSWNLIFEDFSKFCPENSSFIKIWQE
jgi:hypothetical protein